MAAGKLLMSPTFSWTFTKPFEGCIRFRTTEYRRRLWTRERSALKAQT